MNDHAKAETFLRNIEPTQMALATQIERDFEQTIGGRLRCCARWHHDRANAAGRGEPDGYGGTLSLRDMARHIAIRNSIREQLNG